MEQWISDMAKEFVKAHHEETVGPQIREQTMEVWIGEVIERHKQVAAGHAVS